MREKNKKTLFLFAETTDALEFEEACHTWGVPGRLLPVPSSLKAGCGICWACAPGECAAVLNLIHKMQLNYERQTDYLLWE